MINKLQFFCYLSPWCVGTGHRLVNRWIHGMSWTMPCQTVLHTARCSSAMCRFVVLCRSCRWWRRWRAIFEVRIGVVMGETDKTNICKFNDIRSVLLCWQWPAGEEDCYWSRGRCCWQRYCNSVVRRVNAVTTGGPKNRNHYVWLSISSKRVDKFAQFLT